MPAFLAHHRATLLALALAATWLCLFRNFEAEDSYIVHRYGHNLASGHGLVYNLNERVCALTSPLHGLLSGILHACFGHAAPAIWRFLGAAMLLLGSLALARSFRLRDPARGILLLTTTAAPCAALWSIGGLETPLLFLWVCVAVILTRAAGDSTRSPSSSILSLSSVTGLAFLTRYDSILFFAPLLLATTARHVSRLGLCRAFALALGPAAILSSSWLAFAYYYFGAILPTSAYVKVAADSANPFLAPLYAFQFLLVTGLPLLWIAARFARHSPPTETPPSANLRPVLVSLIALAPYAIYAGSVHMMFAYRFFVPYLPALAILAVVRFGHVLQRGCPVAILAVHHSAVALWILFVGVNPSITLEYSGTPLASYNQFMADLRHSAQLIHHDWTKHRPTPPRPLRLQTFTAGMPYQLPSDTYVMDDQGLISGRASLPKELRNILPRFADYVHFMEIDHPDAPAWQVRRARALLRHAAVATYPLRLRPFSALFASSSMYDKTYMHIVRRPQSDDPRASLPPRVNDPLPQASLLRSTLTPTHR